jgi:flagellar motor switch protein FliN/FliY
MVESQSDIDALLAEAEAVSVGDEAEAVSSAAGDADAPADQSPAQAPTAGPVEDAGEAPAAAVSEADRPLRDPTRTIYQPGAERRREEVARILKIEVPVIVRLARCNMPLSRIMDLTPGSILEFDKPADDPLELMINNECIGVGQAVKVGEKFGLRIGHIGSVGVRIEAMGQSKR